MAEAVIAASLISSGASAVAGSAAVASLGATAASTIATIGSYSSALSLASTAFSGIQQFFTTRAAASAEKLASRERAAELRLQAQAENTQLALENAERERRARRAMASQRASFAGLVDFTSGSPVRIAEEATGSINREARKASNASELKNLSLNRQALSEERAGIAKEEAGFSNARSGLFQTGSLLSRDFNRSRELGLI